LGNINTFKGRGSWQPRIDFFLQITLTVRNRQKRALLILLILIIPHFWFQYYSIERLMGIEASTVTPSFAIDAINNNNRPS